MTLRRGFEECLALTGIPISHQKAFLEVATAQQCIIMSRAVGTACTQLIEEGYSSKGFHIKAKSCNWGPMSGFVLEDPNLTKRAPNETGKQSSDLKHAFEDWNAKSTPLYITEARRGYLERTGVIQRVNGGNNNTHIVWGKQYPGGAKGDNASKALRAMQFVLRRTDGNALKNAPAKVMWAVRYLKPEQATHTGTVDDNGAVHAMINPMNLGGRGGGGVRMAVTGDYDLFSLCVRSFLYRPGSRDARDGTDTRMVGVPDLEKNIKTGKKDVGEHIHQGNMTPRHHMVRNALNEAFKRAGYAGGNMVHHSDEAGRPFIDDVDMPVFAAVPRLSFPHGIENIEDLREFWSTWVREGHYVPFLNPHWMSWLSFGKHKGGKDINPGKDILAAIRARGTG